MNRNNSLRVMAVGDLSFNGGYRRLSANPLQRLLGRWAQADVRLGNLESPFTAAPRVAPAKVALRGSDQAVHFLRQARFDGLSLANNHAMDFGPEGLRDTQTALEHAGLAHHGAGQNEEEAYRPLILERNDQTIGVFSCCSVSQSSPLYAGRDQPGVARLVLDRCVEQIRRLRSQVDWVIVQAHWGEELSELPMPEQRGAARAFVNAGADLILGHHPHVWQPLEWLDGVPVFYSLGNCLFSGMYWRGRTPAGESFTACYRLHPRSRRTGWVEVELRRDRQSTARFHPTFLGRNLHLYPDDSRERQREWEALCRKLSTLDEPATLAGERHRAEKRRQWQDDWRSLPRRLALLLFRHGLLPGAVEGT